MKQRLTLRVLTVTLIFGVLGCRAKIEASQPADEPTELEHDHKGQQGLPHAQGRTFYTLDQYLAHLTTMGMQDRPFYEQVGPDRYRLNVGRGGHGKPPQHFTREELMHKYGFTE